ncbi:glycosyl hydrolase family 88 [Breznakibacter xylanolyticus]|uniref:Glycosyl hydrolase family 88 n=1 Tax=Breznakibacter xylanolyticus TaxID=990 RepID=A0A2W7N512_9BACT|nr:glycoside hydrolase family 88 protein [Breznakibacter xylanolyticus]PZX15138.1 glycosyl hydrolase family 88 [Breznakibacter xylanolyticus]
MTKILPLLLLSLTLLTANAQKCPKPQPMKTVVNDALAFATQQSLAMAHSLADRPNRLPQTTDRFGRLITCNSGWWVSGFFPGVLWYLYENTPTDELRQQAHLISMRVADQQYTTDNHDVGFMIFCPFGNALRLTGDTTYATIIRNASNSLITRFRPATGCILSWDRAEWNKQWQYPVIIDNMMNLEMLMWAAGEFKNDQYAHVAITHANTTLQHHYRPDYSCYHVVSYDTLTGRPELKHTAQGYSHASAWARGQGWGLYGYTMMYRFTRDTTYLNHARHIAAFILNHPRLPSDKIPYWDFDAPNIPDTYRDASAGALICSALIELSGYVDAKTAKQYLSVAETQLRALAAPPYRNAPGNNGNFILKHSVGHMPNNTEVDVPLTYADYYFVEALVRYKKLKGW